MLLWWSNSENIHTHTDIQQWPSPLHYQEPGRWGLHIWSQWTTAAHRSRKRGKPQPKAPNSRRIQLLQKPVQAGTRLRKFSPKEESLRHITTLSSSLSLTRVLIMYQLISTHNNSMRQILLVPFHLQKRRGPRGSVVAHDCLDHTLKWVAGPDPKPKSCGSKSHVLL